MDFNYMKHPKIIKKRSIFWNTILDTLPEGVIFFVSLGSAPLGSAPLTTAHHRSLNFLFIHEGRGGHEEILFRWRSRIFFCPRRTLMVLMGFRGAQPFFSADYADLRGNVIKLVFI